MFKNCLTALAFVALSIFASGSAFAVSGITVDGLITDWEAASLLYDDPDGDGAGGFDIRRYGATVIGGTFYAVIEIDQAASNYTLVFPGSWINSDQSAPEELLNLPTGLGGTDINLEWGRGAGEGSGTDKDFNFWGASDNVANVIAGGVTGGAHADSGTAAMGVFEWSAPVSSIVTAIGSLPDNASTAYPWTVMLAGEGDAGGWGRDLGGPVIVPEPGTLALLAGGLLGLLCYAWRRRK
jgi:hypothetical protein